MKYSMNEKTSFFRTTPRIYFENTIMSVVDGYIDKKNEAHTHVAPTTTFVHQSIVYNFAGFFLLSHEQLPPEYLFEYDNIFYYSQFEERDENSLSDLLGLKKIYGDQYSDNLMDFSKHSHEQMKVLICFEQFLDEIQTFVYEGIFSIKKSTVQTMNCLDHFSKNFTYCNNSHKKQILYCPAFVNSESGEVLDLSTLYDIFNEKVEFIKSFKAGKNSSSDERVYSNEMRASRNVDNVYGEIIYNKGMDRYFRLDSIENNRNTCVLINRKVRFGIEANSSLVGCQEDTVYTPSKCIKLGLYTDFTERSILLLNIVKYLQLTTTFKHYENTILKYSFRNKMIIPNIVRHITYYKYRMHVQVDNYLDIRKVLGAHYTTDTNNLTEPHEQHFWETVPSYIHEIYFDYTQQYLSLIGSKAIQFVISTNSFFALPDCDQHVLTQVKSCLVNKSNLSSLYFKLKLNNIVLYGSNCLVSETLNKQNIYSQCVLVLMGALYMDSINLKPIYNLLSDLLLPDDSIRRKWLDLGGYYRTRKIIPLNKRVVHSSKQLESELGVVFESKDLLLIVINGLSTDPNKFKDNYETFERLEFLGDAVLEFIVNIELILNQGICDGDAVAMQKTALTNNNFLREVIEGLNIEKYYMANKSEHVNFKSKRYADIFEALVGAIYVDKGLETCYYFLKKNILNLNKEELQQKVNGIRQESKNDKNLLSDLVVYYENLSKQKGSLEYRSKQVKDLNDLYFVCEVYYNDLKCGESSGPTKSIAEKNAAGISYDFIFQNREILWGNIE